MATTSNKKWSLDLNIKEFDVGHSKLQNTPPPLGMRRVAALEKQNHQQMYGKKGVISNEELSAKEKTRALAIAKKKSSMAMGLATGPGKSLFMNGFMMYMSGSTLNMWSISVTGMSIMTPLKNMFGISTQFKRFEDSSGKVDLQMPKLIFIALNLLWLCVGLYKMSKMRLLPTVSADWSGRVVWKELMEVSSIPPL
eukprot:234237_1